MKILTRFLAVLAILFLSCNSKQAALNEKLPFEILNYFGPVDSSKSVIINIINPEDCLSCLSVAKMYFDNLDKVRLPRQNFLFLFPNKREIEKPALLEKFSLSTEANNLIFNDSILDLFNKVFIHSDFTSYLVVYNKKLRWQNSMQITKLNKVEEINYMIPEK